MFLRRTRGLKDLLLASLCLWGACYHTPPGAALRGTLGWLVGQELSWRVLLTYYNGGVYAPEVVGKTLPLPSKLPRAPLDEREALGQGLQTVWAELASEQREPARALARSYGVRDLDPEKDSASAMAALLRRLTRELDSEEAAVLAVLCGLEPARYALERARAEKAQVTLEDLVRMLPPGYDRQTAAASAALMLGKAMSLGWPAPLTAPVTSPFGPRQHPLLGQQRFHKGIDIYLKEGTPVAAAGDGVVAKTGSDPWNGIWVLVDHGRGVTTLYCHNVRQRVSTGQWLKRGDVVADSGRTGRVTGPHLHYQLELGRVPVDPVRFRSGRSFY